MPEEVRSDDRFLDVGDDEYPLEVAAKAAVEGKRAFAICGDRCVVNSHEGELVWCVFTIGEGGRYDAHLRTSVHQKARTSTLICNERAGDIHRR